MTTAMNEYTEVPHDNMMRMIPLKSFTTTWFSIMTGDTFSNFVYEGPWHGLKSQEGTNDRTQIILTLRRRHSTMDIQCNKGYDFQATWLILS
jgi:hypothetical protein